MPISLRRFARTRLGLGVTIGLLAVIVVLAQTPLLRGASSLSSPLPVATAQAPSRPEGSTASAQPTTAAQPAASSSAASGPSFSVAYQDPQVQPAPNGLATILNLLLKLAIVIGLIYGTVWVLRFLNQRSTKSLLGERLVTVLETTRLAANRDLYLVDLADRVLLLGSAGSSLNLLTEITEADALDAIRNRPQAALPSADAFLGYLRGFGEKLGSLGAGEDARPELRAGEDAHPTAFRAGEDAHPTDWMATGGESRGAGILPAVEPKVPLIERHLEPAGSGRRDASPAAARGLQKAPLRVMGTVESKPADL
ncbi:MAG: FliO/MopB family protein, partial [Chloroflexota bacterium]|nr:FliO/MopB family protein [Chloroflexota bacterium]